MASKYFCFQAFFSDYRVRRHSLVTVTHSHAGTPGVRPLLLSTLPEPDRVLPLAPSGGSFFLSAPQSGRLTTPGRVVQVQLARWSRSIGGPSDKETRRPNNPALSLSFSAEH